MRIRSVDIHNQTFSVSFRGFDPGEVDEFLEKIADELELLNSEKEDLERALVAERETRAKVEEALAASHNMQRTIVDHARREAQQITNGARADAKAFIEETRSIAKDYLRDLEVLKEKRITFLSELAGMASMLSEWVERQPDEPGHDTSALEELLSDPMNPTAPELEDYAEPPVSDPSDVKSDESKAAPPSFVTGDDDKEVPGQLEQPVLAGYSEDSKGPDPEPDEDQTTEEEPSPRSSSSFTLVED